MRALTTADIWNKGHGLTGKSFPHLTLYRADRELSTVIRPLLEPRRGGKLIEFGCGDSCWLPYFSRSYDLSVAGIDFAADRLQRTRANLAAANVPGQLILGDFMDTDYLPADWYGSFDVVYSGGVVEHFDHPELVLRHFSQFLKPGGVLITTIPHLRGFWGALQTKINKESGEEYVKLEMKDALELHRKAGLHISYSAYFRWLDFGILNYSPLPPGLRHLCYGFGLGTNMLLSLVLQNRRPAYLPETFYADMLIGATKP